ncbi:hypothetical protein J2S46_002022 [Kitasatospora herbaricolor]|uniref:hypothetical protein n=1 Tax=Kitasatospora herbaricolor TaxID=68217 RepID=UPI00174DF19E|nr:hypothetical protein [Kitasatospora herbaricolor]MDQ0307466.1 hypothetical protein [Kitasatospora herbaricolor]
MRQRGRPSRAVTVFGPLHREQRAEDLLQHGRVFARQVGQHPRAQRLPGVHVRPRGLREFSS